jgi:hypothetical protein
MHLENRAAGLYWIAVFDASGASRVFPIQLDKAY